MAPISKRPCVYADSGCTWTTLTSHLITTREETEAYMRAHSSECLQNPLVQEARQRTMEREDAERLRRIEAEQRQEDAATAECQARVNEREEE